MSTVPKWVVWTAIGVGVAGAAAGTTAVIVRRNRKKRIEESHTPPPTSIPDPGVKKPDTPKGKICLMMTSSGKPEWDKSMHDFMRTHISNVRDDGDYPISPSVADRTAYNLARSSIQKLCGKSDLLPKNYKDMQGAMKRGGRGYRSVWDRFLAASYESLSQVVT